MKVYLNKDTLGKERKIVEAELIEKRSKSYLVRLPDGNTIIRKEKDIVKDEPVK